MLDDNAFTDADVAMLAQQLAASRLRSLSMRDCKLGPLAAGHLGRALGEPPRGGAHGGGLTELDVSLNPLGDDGVVSLSGALRLGSSCGSTLQTLRLARCGSTAKGARALAAALRGNRSLLVLDMADNPGLCDAGARVLATCMGPHGAWQLASVDLSGCGIGQLGVLELGNAICDAGMRCSLRQLNLAGNPGAQVAARDEDTAAELPGWVLINL